MIKSIAAAAVAALLSLNALAEPAISVEQIRQVIAASDAAAMRRDPLGIGLHLSEHFEKTIEVPYQGWTASMKLGKQEYLDLIEQGWTNMKEYSYRRADTVINIAADGLSGESSSTITEAMLIDGQTRVSRIREYAHYALENGRTVITWIGGHPLVGDTMPEVSN
jgi:hypothetical protein